MTLAQRLTQLADEMQRTDDLVGNPMGGERRFTIAQLRELAAECVDKVLVKPVVDRPAPWQPRPRPFRALFPMVEAWGATEAEAVEHFQAEIDRVAARAKALRDKEAGAR